MNNLYAIILAGGASSRFWPLSGDEHPKYLLKPDGRRHLLAMAWERAALCAAPEHILVITSLAQARRVAHELPDLLHENLIIEPARRDTAAAIALGVKMIGARKPDAHVLVIPADQIIEPSQALCDATNKARGQADFDEFLHVFGVKPQRPEPGFGYIKADQCFAPGLCRVVGFREKPDAATVQRYAIDGLHYWNAGCLLFSVPTFELELAHYLPSHSTRLKQADHVDKATYSDLEPISIDYGMLEKTQVLRMIQLEAEFDDIGTWDALLAHMEKHGAPARSAFSSEGRNNSVLAHGGEIVGIVGLDDVLVVVEGGRVLVLRKGLGQKVKEVARLDRSRDTTRIKP